VKRQPLEIQTLFAELLERLASYEASRSIGYAAGTFVTKDVKGQEYLYFQHSGPGGKKRQTYLGRSDESLASVVERFSRERINADAEQESIERLATLLRAGGAMITDTSSARVIKALAEAGVFRLGGVCVGTHAFLVIGNLLGVRWEHALATQDIDIAADPVLNVAVPDLSADLPSALDSLEMGFVPVPGLEPGTPSTSFKVRGQSLRVDLLTPSRTGLEHPVSIRRFAATAQPLKFLDYIMESPVRAAVLGSGAVSVNVPQPARFALHKMVVAQERPSTFHSKRDKDLSQAAELLDVLLEDRPDDVRMAWEGLRERGKRWESRVLQSVDALERFSPSAAKNLRKLS
jgi:hypothetical protein